MMWAAVLAFGLALGSFGGISSAATVRATKQEMLNYCKILEIYAGYAMVQRQGGVAMSEQIKDIVGDGWEEDISRGVVADAYEVPRFATDKEQDRAVSEFSNKIYAGCYKMITAPQPR